MNGKGSTPERPNPDPRVVQLIRPSPFAAKVAKYDEAPSLKKPATLPPATSDASPFDTPKRHQAQPRQPSVTAQHPSPPLTTERKGPRKREKGERVDWEGMESHYRANHLSLRELGEMFGVTAAAIIKHARKEVPPWQRDLTEAIDAQAEALVNAASLGLVNGGVNAEVEKRPVTPASALVISATAELIANIRLGQRDRFKQVATLAVDMFVALRDQFANRESLETLGDLMEKVDDNGKPDALSKLYREVTELPGAIKALKDLTEIIGKVTAMETVAYKLEKVPEGNDNSRSSLPIRFVESPMVERVDDEDEFGT